MARLAAEVLGYIAVAVIVVVFAVDWPAAEVLVRNLGLELVIADDLRSAARHCPRCVYQASAFH